MKPLDLSPTCADCPRFYADCTGQPEKDFKCKRARQLPDVPAGIEGYRMPVVKERRKPRPSEDPDTPPFAPGIASVGKAGLNCGIGATAGRSGV